MNFKNYKYYIVVDEDNRPMSFDGHQLCYCNTHHSASPFAVQPYTHEEAKRLIRETVNYRITKRMSEGNYNLMPVAPKIKKRVVVLKKK